MRYRTILLFGPPGSGKGTQGRILGMIPGFFHCSCGDLFRRLDPQSDEGRRFLEFVQRGQLVPDEPTCEFWQSQMAEFRRLGRYSPERDVLVLDGIPRTVGQARLLADVIDVRGVLYLSCPQQEKLVQRMRQRALLENRLDDGSVEVIRRRMDVFERDTRPVLDHYGPAVLHAVDATRPVEVVLQVILAVVNSVDLD